MRRMWLAVLGAVIISLTALALLAVFGWQLWTQLRSLRRKLGHAADRLRPVQAQLDAARNAHGVRSPHDDW
jgi:hypothetical protein